MPICSVSLLAQTEGRGKATMIAQPANLLAIAVSQACMQAKLQAARQEQDAGLETRRATGLNGFAVLPCSKCGRHSAKRGVVDQQRDLPGDVFVPFRHGSQ